MLRLLTTPNQPPEPGWVSAETPLGASAHVQVHSPAHELCEDWRMLTSGRMQLVTHTNFTHWFGPLFDTAPIGLVAELLMANGMEEHFARLVHSRPAARDYIQALPDYCHALDEEEWRRMGRALDIVRTLEARSAASKAAREALDD